MELKVWVEDVPRVVCGITDATTCQDVIYALAHASGKIGRFVLIEKFRTSERSLSPQDRPLKILSKWKEYAADVEFVLRCLSESEADTGSGEHGWAVSSSRPSVTYAPITSMQPCQLSSVNYSSVSVLEGGGSNRWNGPGSPRATGQIAAAVYTRGQPCYSPTSPAARRSFSPQPLCSSPPQAKAYFVDTANPDPESGTLLTHPKHTRVGSNPEPGLYTSVVDAASQAATRAVVVANQGLTAIGGHSRSAVAMAHLHDVSPSPVPSLMSQASARRRGRPPPYGKFSPPSEPGKARPPPPSYEYVVARNVVKRPEEQNGGEPSDGRSLTVHDAARAKTPTLPTKVEKLTAQVNPTQRMAPKAAFSHSPLVARGRSKSPFVASPLKGSESPMPSKWGSGESLINIFLNQKLMIQEQEHRLNSLESNIRELSENEGFLLKEIDAMGKEIRQLESKEKLIRGEIEKIGPKAFLDSELEVIKKQSAQLDTEISDLLSKLDAQNQELDCHKSDMQMLSEVLAQEKQTTKDETEIAAADDASVEEQIQRLKEQLAQVDNEGQEVERSLGEVQSEIGKIEHVIREKRERLEELASKIKTTAGLCGEVSSVSNAAGDSAVAETTTMLRNNEAEPRDVPVTDETAPNNESHQTPNKMWL